MEWLAPLILGVMVTGFGGLFLVRHLSLITRLRQDEELLQQEQQFLIRQQQRRVLTSTLLILVGVLIPLSYYVMAQLQNALLATLLLLGILGLIGLIVLLALGDLVSGRHLRADLQLRKAEAELRRALLENEIREKRPHSPGSPSAESRND